MALICALTIAADLVRVAVAKQAIAIHTGVASVAAANRALAVHAA